MESADSIISELHQLATIHQIEHHCGAHPYENIEELLEAVQSIQPQNILEIGTGVGYTAIAMSLAVPEANIDSLEKDEFHASFAKQFLEKFNPKAKVNIIVEPAEQYLAATNKSYDFIFFDGFQIHYEFLPHYNRLLKKGGVLFLANNHLQSRTSEKFFLEFEQSSNWKILKQFAETTIAQRN